MGEWTDVRGEFLVELYALDAHTDQPVPIYWELLIEFTSSGYLVEGRDYPPEHGDERVPVAAWLIGDTKVKLSPKKMNELFDHFEDKIYETELI